MVSSSEAGGKRIGAQGKDAGWSASRGSIRLTARDGEILAWLGRYRFATAGQSRRRFSLGRSRAYQRTRDLARAGYLSFNRPFFSDQPGVYVATRAGLAVAACPLAPATVDVRSFRHDLRVVDLALDLELRGLAVLSERELRHAEGLNGGTTPAALSIGAPGDSGRHFPDLLVSDGDRYWAVEVELTPKRTERLERILNSYRRARHVTAVAYYVERPRLAARLEEIGRRLRMEDRLDVRVLPGGQDGG